MFVGDLSAGGNSNAGPDWRSTRRRSPFQASTNGSSRRSVGTIFQSLLESCTTTDVVAGLYEGQTEMVVIDAIARFLFDGFLELLNGALGEPSLVVDPTKSI